MIEKLLLKVKEGILLSVFYEPAFFYIFEVFWKRAPVYIVLNKHSSIVFSGDPSDISWKTSVICERISTNVVRSKKGTLYFLLGEINANDMIEKSKSKI
jgi:hypothetical protein